MRRSLTKASPSQRLRQVVRLYGTDLSVLSRVVMPPTASAELAAAYQELPRYDVQAESYYMALREEVKRQFDLLTTTCGIEVVVSRSDPYKSAAALIAEVDQDERLRVWSTAACDNSHPLLTDDENDMLRAVHDAFGHFATGRGFDISGEEIAWRAQAPMFSAAARRALATELRGSTNHALHYGEFAGQRAALLPARWSGFELPPEFEGEALR